MDLFNNFCVISIDKDLLTRS